MRANPRKDRGRAFVIGAGQVSLSASAAIASAAKITAPARNYNRGRIVSRLGLFSSASGEFAGVAVTGIARRKSQPGQELTICL